MFTTTLWPVRGRHGMAGPLDVLCFVRVPGWWRAAGASPAPHFGQTGGGIAQARSVCRPGRQPSWIWATSSTCWASRGWALMRVALRVPGRRKSAKHNAPRPGMQGAGSCRGSPTAVLTLLWHALTHAQGFRDARGLSRYSWVSCATSIRSLQPGRGMGFFMTMLPGIRSIAPEIPRPVHSRLFTSKSRGTSGSSPRDQRSTASCRV